MVFVLYFVASSSYHTDHHNLAEIHIRRKQTSAIFHYAVPFDSNINNYELKIDVQSFGKPELPTLSE